MVLDLGDIVASGRATPEQWNEYWSAYAEEAERQEHEKRRQQEEARATQTGGVHLDEAYSLEGYDYAEGQPEECEEDAGILTRRFASAGRAGIGLGSALAVVLSFELNHSIPWAIIHGALSWIYVLYRLWRGNY